MRTGGADLLSRQALNRATLQRQLLLTRVPASPCDVLEHLVGMQAQAPRAPYVGLWSRVAGFDPQELSELVAQRAVVRAPLLRATVHLVTAADFWRSTSVAGAHVAEVVFHQPLCQATGRCGTG